MAKKVMHRVLDLGTGEIRLTDWVYDGYVSLNEIHIEYDDQLTPAHAQMVTDAIDKRVKKMHADIVVMENKKQDFLALTNKGPINGEWEEVNEGDECPSCKDRVLEYPPTVDCFCHLSPPCSHCTDKVLTCDTCGWEDNGD